MRRSWTWTVLVAVGLMSTALMSAEEKEDKDKEEVKIKFADCPAAVQKTLKREAGGAKIEEVEKEDDDGKAVYEAEVKIDGKNYSIEVAEDGTLLEKELDEDDDEVEIKFADCPAAVQKTLQREAPGVKIEKVDQEPDAGRMIYEADVKIDGKNYEIEVTAEGLLISKKLDEDDEDEKDGKAEAPKKK